MSERMLLIGSEDVSRAGYAMRDAADSFGRHVSNFDASVATLVRNMDETAEKLRRILEINIELAAMQAENECRASAGSSPAYSSYQFMELIGRL